MAASQKVLEILTKYFMCINQGHYVIIPAKYEVHMINTLARPDNTYANKAKIMIPYYDEIVNHDYIGSFWQCQMSQKLVTLIKYCLKLLMCSGMLRSDANVLR